MKKIIYLFTLTLFSLPVFSQTTITGVIQDSLSGESLIGASVLILNSKEGTISDENGAFSLTSNAELPFTLRVSYLGYKSFDFDITGDTQLNVLLPIQHYIGETVVVSVSRRKEKLSEAPASISVIDSRRINSMALSHPAQHLRNVPGVFLSQQGIDHVQITLRGRVNSFFTDTYYLHDYRTLVSPGTADATLSRTGLSDIDLDRIEVIRGPGSALYGPGVETGVIHFISKSPFDTGTTISVGGGTKSSMHFAGRFANKLSDKFAYKFVTHYNRAKDWDLDPTDSTDIESLAAIVPTVISPLDGSVLRENVTSLEDQTESYGVTGTFEYKFNDKTSLTSNSGWYYRKGLVRATLGEALSDFADHFTQLRLTSDKFFVNAGMNVLNNTGQKGFLYRTGLSSYTKNTAYQLQTQYLFEDLIPDFDLAIGAEAQITENITKGTVHGRYEDNDNFKIFSAYTQATYDISDKLEFVVAGRVDRFSAINETSFSPRLALVYKILPTHNLRFTYNRAISSPTAIDIYADIPFARLPGLDIILLGGLDPVTYSDPLTTTSYLGGTYSGTDLDLAVPYAIALSSLETSFTSEVFEYLNSLQSSFNSASEGSFSLNGQAVTSLPTRGTLRSNKTSSYEVGYKGVIGSKFAINLDVYYNKRKDLTFLSEASASVHYENLASDLVSEFNNVSSSTELENLGTSQADIAAQLESFAATLAAGPLGIIEPDFAADSETPQFILTYYNSGAIDYYGADLGLSYYYTDELMASVNFSWLSKNVWTDEELGSSGSGQSYYLNVPDKIFKLGIDYIPSEKGIGYNASFRYQGEVEVNEGAIYNGLLQSYSVLDAGVNYNFGNGMRINLTAQNLLGQEYRVMPRMPKVGRLVLVNVRKEF